MTANVGTSLWMAPETMLGDKYGVVADMISFGVLLSELDTHLLPYSHAKDSNNADRKMPDAAILQMATTGTLRVALSAEASSSSSSVALEIVALGVACVSSDPSGYPTAAEGCTGSRKRSRPCDHLINCQGSLGSLLLWIRTLHACCTVTR